MPVWAVLDYTDTHCIERELLLAKVSILGPEYLEDQLLGGPTHEPRPQAPISPSGDKLARETALAQHFEHSADPGSNAPASAHAPAPVPLTPSELLRLKSDNLQAIQVLSAQFAGRIVDVSEHSVIVEMCGKTKRVEAFLSLLKPFGVLESARTGACADGRSLGGDTGGFADAFLLGTGLMVMPRTPFKHTEEADEADEGGSVDASLLPPG